MWRDKAYLFKTELLKNPGIVDVTFKNGGGWGTVAKVNDRREPSSASGVAAIRTPARDSGLRSCAPRRNGMVDALRPRAPDSRSSCRVSEISQRRPLERTARNKRKDRRELPPHALHPQLDRPRRRGTRPRRRRRRDRGRRGRRRADPGRKAARPGDPRRFGSAEHGRDHGAHRFHEQAVSFRSAARRPGRIRAHRRLRPPLADRRRERAHRAPVRCRRCPDRLERHRGHGLRRLVEHCLPCNAAGVDQDAGTGHGTTPSLAEIDKFLVDVGVHWAVSAARPDDVAGRAAYSAAVSPKHDGGLLGSVELAWDAIQGTPLRLGVFAEGASTPALQLEVTNISYGAVPASDVDVSPPSGAKVVDLGSPAGANQGSGTPAVTGLAASTLPRGSP